MAREKGWGYPDKAPKLGRDEELTVVRHLLKKAGFDSIVHRGGRGEGMHHLVNIAFDPEQIYKPFVAGKYKSMKLPATGASASLGSMLAGAGLSQGEADEKRKKMLLPLLAAR
jgi:hypothetical protein